MKKLLIAVVMLVSGCCLSACEFTSSTPQSASGVEKISVTVQKDASGMTVEQKNVSDRLTMDNKPGSIKHLYVISAYSGQTIIYSTVRGKVTSSGKRLTPTSTTGEGEYNYNGIPFSLGGKSYDTSEVLQDDGTYGNSAEYLYWWDVQGRYHQHYVSGGQIVHVSDQPLAVKSVIINMEMK